MHHLAQNHVQKHVSILVLEPVAIPAVIHVPVRAPLGVHHLVEVLAAVHVADLAVEVAQRDVHELARDLVLVNVQVDAVMAQQ